mmetsp:Transcript_81028/g.148593  ORF Transcript_81028/g.148593 Transcript_81028/m.148593 type:complete len:117 (+) Transcript_81028:252-602(+)
MLGSVIQKHACHDKSSTLTRIRPLTHIINSREAGRKRIANPQNAITDCLRFLTEYSFPTISETAFPTFEIMRVSHPIAHSPMMHKKVPLKLLFGTPTWYGTPPPSCVHDIVRQEVG